MITCRPHTYQGFDSDLGFVLHLSDARKDKIVLSNGPIPDEDFDLTFVGDAVVRCRLLWEKVVEGG